jgi:hypothetical protein
VTLPLYSLQSPIRTKDPHKADLFFVPIYGECFLWQWEMLKHVGAEKSFQLTNDFFQEAMNIIKKQARPLPLRHPLSSLLRKAVDLSPSWM